MNDLINNFPGLVNVQVVLFLRRLINTAGAERTLNKWGFPVDLKNYLELQLQQQYPDQNSDGLMYWIANNYTYFLTGDPVEVTKSINNYLLLNPKCISILGYPICIYTDPAHLRQYALWLIGGIVFYKYVIKK